MLKEEKKRRSATGNDPFITYGNKGAAFLFYCGVRSSIIAHYYKSEPVVQA